MVIFHRVFNKLRLDHHHLLYHTRGQFLIRLLVVEMLIALLFACNLVSDSINLHSPLIVQLVIIRNYLLQSRSTALKINVIEINVLPV